MNDILRQKIKDLPTSSGVYIMYSQSGQILYIGKAKVLKNRVSQYFNAGVKTEKVARMVSKVYTFDYIITRNEVEALVLENNLIKQHKPPYNILLKDDKNYPFIRIDVKADFPRVEVVRKLKADGAKYFGPYMQGISSRDITDLIYSAFSLRSCSLNMNKIPSSHRPCLNHHIGRCLAPCTGCVSREEYKKQVDGVISFLGGNDKKVEEMLIGRMRAASEREDYEQALYYKQKLEVLDKLVRRQVTALPKDLNIDVFAIASSGLNTVAAVLFVRGGKLLGGDKQVIEDVSPDEKSALSSYISRYASQVGYVADEVVTSVQLDDEDAMAEYLSGIKGKRVNVICPHQGIRRQLADMAESNAKDFLEKSLSVRERHDNMTVGAMMQLGELLRLPRIPVRMECYDISHVSGTDKVASMVVFINGEPARGHYRKFHIREVEGNNDFASLQEALSRRLARLEEAESAELPEEDGDISGFGDPDGQGELSLNGENVEAASSGEKAKSDISFSSRPDLIVIDGGKGQLSSVLEAVGEWSGKINFISLAKREEEVFVPHQSQPVILPRDSYALKLLQRIRDEAHRFAITFHRNTRGKRMRHSSLEEIPNVGEKAAKKLLKSFGTIAAIKQATVPELMQVVNRRAAESVYNYYNGEEE